jgi:hypothetical protein
LPSNGITATNKCAGKIPIIDPRAVLTIEQARVALHLAKNCLPREIRLGRLRVAKRAGKYLILGEWLLEWIKAGELPRRQPPSEPRENGAAAKAGRRDA